MKTTKFQKPENAMYVLKEKGSQNTMVKKLLTATQ
jgi:hypothetical protein